MPWDIAVRMMALGEDHSSRTSEVRKELCDVSLKDALQGPKERSRAPLELLLGYHAAPTGDIIKGELVISRHAEHSASPADPCGVVQGDHPARELQCKDGHARRRDGDKEWRSQLKPRLLREVQPPRTPFRPPFHSQENPPDRFPRKRNGYACDDPHLERNSPSGPTKRCLPNSPLTVVRTSPTRATSRSRIGNDAADEMLEEFANCRKRKLLI